MRYHLAGLPLDSLDPDTFQLTVKGKVEKPLTLSLKDLKATPGNRAGGGQPVLR